MIIECVGHHDNDLIRTLCHQKIKFKPIQTFSEVTRQLTTIGEIFFYKLSDWGSVINGRLLEFYDLHRFHIRNNLPIPPKINPVPERKQFFANDPTELLQSTLQININF